MTSLEQARVDAARMVADADEIEAVLNTEAGKSLDRATFIAIADKGRADAAALLNRAYLTAFTQTMRAPVGAAIAAAVNGREWCKGYDHHRVYVGARYFCVATMLWHFRNGDLTPERAHLLDNRGRTTALDDRLALKQSAVDAVNITYAQWRQEQA